MPWYIELAKKLWIYLTTQEKGKPKERIAILTFSVLTSLVTYFYVMDTFAPSRNIVRRFWGLVSPNDYTLYSGGAGGVYEGVGKIVQRGTAKGIAVKNRLLSKEKKESARDNVARVLADPFSFAIVEEGYLLKSGATSSDIITVGPIYDERLHILYRHELYQEALDAVHADTLEASGARRSTTESVSRGPVLGPEPERVLQEFFSRARVRTSTSKPEAGAVTPVGEQILDLCGLPLLKPEYKGLKDCIAFLKEPRDEPGAIDVAFLTGGAPLPALEEEVEIKKGTGKLRFMNLDPILIKRLNDLRGMNFVPTSIAGEYGGYPEYNSTLGVRAMLIASKYVPAYAIRDVARSIVLAQENGTTSLNVDLDSFKVLAQVVDNYPSIWVERAKTWFLSSLLILVFFSVMNVFLNWASSSFKSLGYSHALLGIYNRLPSNDELIESEDSIPVPDVNQNNVEITADMIRGIADLLRVIMRIRNDYQSGGLTRAHQTHLIETSYSIKMMFQHHLSRRLREVVGRTPKVNRDAIHDLYTAGYIAREDHNDLIQLLKSRGDTSQTKAEHPSRESAGVLDEEITVKNPTS